MRTILIYILAIQVKIKKLNKNISINKHSMKNTALITGASSGIGQELAHIHAEHGWDLILVARRQDKLDELKNILQEKYNIEVMVIVEDLSVSGSARSLYNKILSSNVEVDYLINNAGFGLRGMFHELTWERQMEMIQLNIVTLTELTYLFLPDMVTRNSGKILNVSSTASLIPGPLQAVYFATKAYVTSMSNALAEELHDTDITVTALLPGATESEFAKTSGMENTLLFSKTVSARSVALDGYRAMLQGKLNIISGLSFFAKIGIFLAPLIPTRMILKQIRKMQEVKN